MANSSASDRRRLITAAMFVNEWPIDRSWQDSPPRETSTQHDRAAEPGNQHADQTQNPEACASAAEMHQPRHEIGKEQKQSAFEKDDPTINLNGFCGATLLRRREKSFEHDAVIS